MAVSTGNPFDFVKEKDENKGFDKEKADIICTRLSSGFTISQACKGLNIAVRNVLRWVTKDSEFAEKYREARKTQVEAMRDEILEIADNDSNTYDKDVGGNYNNHRRIQIDARKWYLSKVVPKLPIPKGTIDNQLLQINEALANGDINEETANVLLKIVSTRFQLAPASEYLEELKKIATHINKGKE